MLLWWWFGVFGGGPAGTVPTPVFTFGHRSGTTSLGGARSGPIVPSTGSRSDA